MDNDNPNSETNNNNSKIIQPSTCRLENISTTIQSLDTVRALHHTVVSLRSALEEAKFEIQRLRSQISTQTDVKEGAKQNRNQPKTIRFEIDDDNNIKNKLPKSPKKKLNRPKSTKSATDTSKFYLDIPEIRCDTSTSPTSSRNQDSCRKSGRSSKSLNTPTGSTGQETYRISSSPKAPADISIITIPHYHSSLLPEDCDNKMASKIDVKIKVLSNIKVGSCNDSSDTSEQPTSSGMDDDKGREFKFSTEENLSVRQDKDGDYIVSQSSKENVNIDENNSDSEGDNSVFEKSTDNHDKIKSVENKEECDDIELIFSSEENRDPIQEEMVSLSEYDPWQMTGGSGTPVLVKFSSLPSEQDSSNMPSLVENDNGSQLPTSSTFDAFSTHHHHHHHHDKNILQEKSLESTDSFDLNQQSLKSMSFERENSEDQNLNSNRTLGRDESLDFFDHKDGSMDRRKWTNYNVLVETDISKCGISEENSFELYQRRNTCPNPPAYRPMMLRDPHFITRHIPSRLSSRYSRRVQYNPAGCITSIDKGPKRSSSAQTEISALPEYWKSECQLAGNRYHIGGPCTLPSKFVPITKKACQKHHSGNSERSSQEARRILLSDINFTSMVPELSRSADHLCQDENRQDDINKQHELQSGYYKGNLLKTPDYALKGITPSTSMTSPGLSQWTVNENSFGTQTIQTGESWGGKRGDSLDSCRSYSIGSRISGLDRHHRSRSVPSVRCAVCRQTKAGVIRTSESMHYTPRVTFQEPSCKIRGSLPDLRQDCMCSRRYAGRTIIAIHGDSSGSTESLLDEADAFVRKSLDGSHFKEDIHPGKRPNLRRMSENDIQRDYIPSKQSLPFLPKTAKCLKPGHLAKVITKNGRVVVGRVRYVGPLVSTKMPTNHNANCNSDENSGNNCTASMSPNELFVGIQLQSKCGDCDGTFEGRKIFDCEPMQGVFVPFKKVIMAWTA